MNQVSCRAARAGAVAVAAAALVAAQASMSTGAFAAGGSVAFDHPAVVADPSGSASATHDQFYSYLKQDGSVTLTLSNTLQGVTISTGLSGNEGPATIDASKTTSWTDRSGQELGGSGKAVGELDFTAAKNAPKNQKATLTIKDNKTGDTATSVVYVNNQSDLGVNPPQNLTYNAANGVLVGGIDVFVTNNGPEASPVTLTVTMVSGGSITGKAKAKGGSSSYTSKTETVKFSSLASGADVEVNVPGVVNGKSTTIKYEVTGPNADVSPSDNESQHTYSHNPPKSSPSASPTKGSGSGGGSGKSSPSASASSSTAAGGSGGSSSSSGGSQPSLPDTGSSSSTPAIAGGAGAVVVLGGGLAFFAMRRRKANAS